MYCIKLRLRWNFCPNKFYKHTVIIDYIGDNELNFLSPVKLVRLSQSLLPSYYNQKKKKKELKTTLEKGWWSKGSI